MCVKDILPQPLSGDEPHTKLTTMVRLPKIKIGEGESERFLNVGSIKKISTVVKHYRKEKLRREQAEIVGIPTAWIGCVNRVGLFSNPLGNLINQCWAHGSSQKRDLDAIRNLDFHNRLASVGLGHFRDPTRIAITKKAEVTLRHDIEKMHPQFTVEDLRNLFGTTFGIVEDGVIEFIHVKDVKDESNNVNVLWQKFTKFKIPLTKIWDTYALKINELHVEHYGRMKKTSHLDVVAIHKDDDWFKNNYKVQEAIDNAYEPSFVKSILAGMISDTDARGVLLKRTEFPPLPQVQPSVELLFPEARRGGPTTLA